MTYCCNTSTKIIDKLQYSKLVTQLMNILGKLERERRERIDSDGQWINEGAALVKLFD